jgi:hypothetical protein
MIIYGTGLYAQRFFSLLEAHKLASKVNCFVDSNSKKWNSKFCGKKIENPEILRAIKDDTVVIIAVALTSGSDDIYSKLIKEYKVSKNKIYSGMFFLDPNWHIYPGALEKEQIGSPHNYWQRTFTKKLLTKYSKKAFCKYYLKTDSYTKNVMDLLNRMYLSKGGYNVFAGFAQYEKARNFSENYYYNEDYFSEISLKNENVTIFDIGTYTGDSWGNFAFLFGNNLKKIYAFEPNKNSFVKAKKRATKYRYKNVIECLNMALDNDKNKLDDMSFKIKSKLFMKLDVEGAEMEILKGAAKIIKKYKPNLAVCVYHYIDDVWKIPEYLKSLVPEYNFVLRGGGHLVCYGGV